MTIDQRRYVDIASGVVGATAAAMQKLDLRIMTNSELVPSNSVLEFKGATAVAEHFGANSPEAQEASAYFAYVSPAPVSRPRAIQFAPHTTENRAPTLTGTSPGTIGTLTALEDPEVTLQWTDGGGEDSETHVVDFSAAVSYADIADILSTAFTNATFSYRQLAGAGVFVVTLSGSDYSEVFFNPNEAVDALGLSGAVFSPEATAQTMLESYLATLQASDSFGSIWFMEQGGLEDVVETAEMNASQNVKH